MVSLIEDCLDILSDSILRSLKRVLSYSFEITEVIISDLFL